MRLLVSTGLVLAPLELVVAVTARSGLAACGTGLRLLVSTAAP